MPPPPSAPAASLSSSTSTLVFSGKTRAFLSKAEKAGGGSNAPLEVIDAESGEVVKLNAVAAVGGLPARAPQDRQQLTIPASVVAGCTDRASLAAAIQSYQHSQLAQLVASEAARESLRRELLKSERDPTRRTLLKKLFISERAAAANEIKQLKSNQDVALHAQLRERLPTVPR